MPHFGVAGMALIPVAILMSVCWFDMQVSDQVSLLVYRHFDMKYQHKQLFGSEFYGWVKIVDPTRKLVRYFLLCDQIVKVSSIYLHQVIGALSMLRRICLLSSSKNMFAS